MIRSLTGYFALIVLMSSCQNNILVSKEFSLKENMWETSNKISFEFDVADTSQVYDMELNITHAEDYGYQNLYVKISTIFPSGKEQSSVTSLELAEKDGTWSGKCGGNTCDLSLPLQQQFTFPESGKYLWAIEPYMRIDTIKGIESLEVICKKAKS